MSRVGGERVNEESHLDSSSTGMMLHARKNLHVAERRLVVPVDDAGHRVNISRV